MAFRWTGTVVPKILPSALLCTVVGTIITVIYEKTDLKPSIPQAFIPVLGFVVGLLLTYRTNTAYDRYWEGRRAWSTMEVAIRTFTRLIWVNLKETDSSDVVQKKTAINLLLGFAIGTKYYLREQEGSKQPDLQPLIVDIRSKLPGYEPLEDQDRAEEFRRASEESASKIDMLVKSKKKPHQREKGEYVPENHNIPLEISLYLSSYIKAQMDNKNSEAPVTTAMLNSLNTMVDCLTTFERILRSPIPIAYSTHLSQTVWVYCLTIPIQFVQLLHWFTIPFVFFATGVLLGIERIGGEIENPFGIDENDLDLDEFCKRLARELNLITAHAPPQAEVWIFSKENVPFGKEAGVTGESAVKLEIDEVRSLLSQHDEEHGEGKTPSEISIKFQKYIVGFQCLSVIHENLHLCLEPKSVKSLERKHYSVRYSMTDNLNFNRHFFEGRQTVYFELGEAWPWV
ncbi:13043_t:CDS:2 [Ambispora gerdemannii]|uniref:13043_t:CDS:1 n=1 Tax=Ambispora gerdemannii TaxID=144530 RepID=A0A9N8V0I2_9GLOM|nr:13043_t:CDS:2 [Ambispora gerdemannii]